MDWLYLNSFYELLKNKQFSQKGQKSLKIVSQVVIRAHLKIILIAFAIDFKFIECCPKVFSMWKE